MNAAFALRTHASRHAGHPDLASARWTVLGITVALVLLFAFFFRMEESVARSEALTTADAQWTQWHWQCSALPVLKQETCLGQLAQLSGATPHGPLVSRAGIAEDVSPVR
jgi:hypothetical protein